MAKRKYKPAKKDDKRKNNGGQNKVNIKDEDLPKIEAMAANGLTVEQIAQVLGMSKATFDKRKAEVDKIAKAHEAGRNKASNNVGKSLYQQAINGNTNAIKLYYGYALGRWEKKESIHSGDGDGGPVKQKIEVIIKDYSEDENDE